jgi:acid stress-induced BolA-like protein IbaG/YrbA
MNKTGDGNHAKFLVISREFSKMATGKLTGEQKDLIESKINALRE